MTEETSLEAPTLSGRVDLSDRTRLRFEGPDAQRFLNGQVTQDVTLLNGSQALPACVCTLKGRVEAEVMLAREPGAAATFRIDGPGALGEKLPARLDRYLIADQVEWEALGDDWRLWHLLGTPEQREAWVADLPEEARALAFDSRRYGVEGIDLWFSVAGQEGLEASIPACEPVALERLRILHGIPAWGAEMSGAEDETGEGFGGGGLAFPSEVHLDGRAVNFHKGCYTGQEVISRLESVGEAKTRLVLLTLEGDVADGAPGELVPGMPLYPASPGDDAASGRSAGALTSVLPADASGPAIALARVSRRALKEKTPLVTRDEHGKLIAECQVRPFLSA